LPTYKNGFKSRLLREKTGDTTLKIWDFHQTAGNLLECTLTI